MQTVHHLLKRRFSAWYSRLTDPYRPERHYMRGPGPKWHAKHAATQTALTAE